MPRRTVRVANPEPEAAGIQGRVAQQQPLQAVKTATKILYVTATLPYGPGESFLIPEVKELLRRGYDVRIVPRSPTYQLVHQDAAELQEALPGKTVVRLGRRARAP